MTRTPHRSGRQRVGVVGGGVMGSAAALALARRGVAAVLFEQFGPGHHRGASHGSSRIFRHGYDDALHIGLAAWSLELWRRLESETGDDLLRLTSAVDHGDLSVLTAKADALAAAGLDHRWLTPAEATARWPGMRFDTAALVHPAAGRLHADAAVAAFQQSAAAAGARIHHHAKVVDIRPGRSEVRVRTGTGVVELDAVIVAPGAWAEDLLADLVPLPPLRTTQEQPVHFRPARPPHDATVGWPSFVHHPGETWAGAGIYGLGSVDGVKIGEHATGPEVHPDRRDFVADPAGVDRLVDYAAQWLPGVDARSAAPLTCLYTCTPDHAFLVDRRDRLVVAAGFSGHGFKFAPAIGEILADAALAAEDDQTSVPAAFRLDRFSTAVPG